MIIICDIHSHCRGVMKAIHNIWNRCEGFIDSILDIHSQYQCVLVVICDI